MISRHYSAFDRIIAYCDKTLRTLVAPTPIAQRPTPATDIPEPHLTNREKKHVAGLMRVNHAGEVCAQALYQGQALTAKLDQVRESFVQAANEEVDHLAWCEQRLQELNSHPSYLNPLWYAGAFTIGAVAGWFGDRWSLGFVAETEDQVAHHLQKHLVGLPQTDQKTRAILQQMQQDESSHAANARTAGAAALPSVVQTAMQLASKVMTTVAYWV